MFNRIRNSRQDRTRSRFAAIKPSFDRLESRVVLSTDTYTNLAGGSWYTAGNWSLGTVPGSGDSPIIPKLTGTATVSIPAGNLLNVPNGIAGAGTISLSGTLQNTAVANGLTVQGKGGTLDNVTMNGVLTVAGGSMGNYDTVTIVDGLHLNNTATIGKTMVGGFMTFTGSQTIDGTGSIVFPSSSFSDDNIVDIQHGTGETNTTLTIGSGITVTAQTGTHVIFGGSSTNYTSETGTGRFIVNNGTISALGNPANGAGANLNLYGTINNNLNATIDYTDGSTGAESGNIINDGYFSVDADRQFVIDGTYTQNADGHLGAELWTSTINQTMTTPLLFAHSSTVDGSVDVYATNGTNVVGTQFFLLKNSGSRTGSFATGNGGTIQYKPNAMTGPNVWDTVSAPPTTLSLQTPTDFAVYGGTPFSVTVTAKDASGNTVTSFNGPVTLFIASPPNVASQLLDASGHMPQVNAVNGVATFTGLSMSYAGSDYKLTAVHRPSALSGTSTTPFSVAYQPSQIRSAYGVDSIGNFPNGPADGTGQTIAIVDAYNTPTITSDLTNFDLQFGLSVPPSFTIIDQLGNAVSAIPVSQDYVGPDPDGPKQGSWEQEATLDVEWAHAIAPDANIVLIETFSDDPANMLIGVKEANKLATGAASLPGVPPVSVVSMSWGGKEGSGGYTPAQENTTDPSFTTPGVTYFASSGDKGDPGQYPAFSPNVVAVGGTELTPNPMGGYQESAWSGSGGGISNSRTLPQYQTAIGIAQPHRTSPDVSMDSYGNTGALIYDSYDTATGNSNWWDAGGTSLATPMWAGLMAIVDQGRVSKGTAILSGHDQTLPILYSLESNFTDIVTGYNNTTFATPGYDLVTGLGTPNAALINAMVNASVVTVTPSSLPNGTVGTPYNQIITASGGNGTITSTYTGTLPSGLTVYSVPQGLQVMGTSMTSGTFTLNVTSTDAYGEIGTQSVMLTIGSGPRIRRSSLSAPVTPVNANGPIVLTGTSTPKGPRASRQSSPSAASPALVGTTLPAVPHALVIDVIRDSLRKKKEWLG